MKIERFEVPGLAQYSYIVSSNGKAAVIDPIRDVDRYITYAAQQDLTITHVLETHIHADFASGSMALAKATGAELALSAHDVDEDYQYAMPHRALRDQEVVEVGLARLQALHTPGHTPEHLSFTLFDTERSASEPIALFSGDFLFVGSMGRPDLLGEAAKQQLALELYRSLHQRLGALHDGVQVYPGHGAGSLCGAGMSDRAESTIGYERATNPLFKLCERDFISAILGSVPPMPSYYPRMKQLNAQGAAGSPALPTRMLSVEEVKALAVQEDIIILDLRRPESFGGAHIEGAINIGTGPNLSLWAGWMLHPTKRLVLVSEEGHDEEARRALVRVGLDHIEGSLKGGMPSWIEAGHNFARITQLSTTHVERRSPDALVLDVRSDNEWAAGHIADAQHIMLGDLPRDLLSLTRDRPIITLCGTGYRSSIAASMLARAGFDKVSSMSGGMTAWNRQQLPVSRV